MKDLLLFFQILISIILISVILLQPKGTGLGSSFGQGGEFYRSKRGLERLLFYATILICFLFFLSSILNIIL